MAGRRAELSHARPKLGAQFIHFKRVRSQEDSLDGEATVGFWSSRIRPGFDLPAPVEAGFSRNRNWPVS